jgi:hypothetical protein
MQLPLVWLGYPSMALALRSLAREVLVLDVRNHPEIDVSPASHIICILVMLSCETHKGLFVS